MGLLQCLLVPSAPTRDAAPPQPSGPNVLACRCFLSTTMASQFCVIPDLFIFFLLYFKTPGASLKIIEKRDFNLKHIEALFSAHSIYGKRSGNVSTLKSLVSLGGFNNCSDFRYGKCTL